MAYHLFAWSESGPGAEPNAPVPPDVICQGCGKAKREHEPSVDATFPGLGTITVDADDVATPEARAALLARIVGMTTTIIDGEVHLGECGIECPGSIFCLCPCHIEEERT